MRRFQITIFILLFIVVGLLAYVRYVDDDSDINRVAGDKIVQDTGRLEIVFLDIGQGDATFITFPDGSTMLVDCAKDARVMEALGRVMRFYERTIDYLLITHPDLDHYGGCIDVMDRFDVGHVVYNGFQKNGDSFWKEFMQAIERETEAGAEYIKIDGEQVWNIASTTLHFLYPDAPVSEIDRDSNNSSIIFKLSFGEQDVLLTGDAEDEVEQYLVETYGDVLDVEVLKAGHHGSGSSSIQAFVDEASPDIAVISAGKDNQYGHPSLRVLRRLERADADIWRTDLFGDILIYIEKDTIYVETE
jgi:competence protein ComEC